MGGTGTGKARAGGDAATLSLGIDIGGTFTDLVLYDNAGGRHWIGKVLTTPDDPARGVIEGVRGLLAGNGIPAARVARVVHATTLFTNALIERKGAVTGLITTEGFRDVLEMGRERKYELYDIFLDTPTPIVPRRLRREVAERLGPDGTIETALDEAALLAEADALVAAGCTSLAILFLHAYANPVHEARARALIAARHPALSITCSHEVAPEIREYERLSTTVANAYVKPLAALYLDRLAGELRALGIGGPFFMMLSNGGLTHVEEAKRTPVQLLESGPAAGALAAAFFGRAGGEEALLALDMGGTTAKAALIEHGEPVIAHSFEAARERRFMEGSGLPILISTIELIEIGAGGGSLASIDALGLLKVGPQSAGAVPGPACYGRGGTEAAVTDADLVLGYLNPDFFLGGAMTIDRAKAEAAMQPLAKATGLSATEVAWGIHDVVNENMASAARVHIAERGKDPRGFALLATGGAGPVHAWHVARKLGLARLICPPAAGVGSTIGLLMAPARIDRVGTLVSTLPAMDWAACEAAYRALEDDARRVLAETGADVKRIAIRRFADMRYQGQGSEIVVELPKGPYSARSVPAITAAFEAVYRALFTRPLTGVPIMTVKLRVAASAPVKGATVALRAAGGASVQAARKGMRKVFFKDAGGYVDCPVYDRYRLPVDRAIPGPAVVEERESTVVIGPGSRFRQQGDGNLVIAMPGAADRAATKAKSAKAKSAKAKAAAAPRARAAAAKPKRAAPRKPAAKASPKAKPRRAAKPARAPSARSKPARAEPARRAAPARNRRAR